MMVILDFLLVLMDTVLDKVVTTPAPDDILFVSQKYTLYSYTKTLYFGNANNSMDLISLILSRYDYQYPGLQNPDTNSGKMFLHGIKISYPTN